jgi:hypothetical protein
MIRPLILSFALLSTPAFAAGHFEARPETQPAQMRLVARDNLWRCGAAGCVSGRTSTRPAIVCSSLAREVGPLLSFSVAGRAFTAEELQACNGRARS